MSLWQAVCCPVPGAHYCVRSSVAQWPVRINFDLVSARLLPSTRCALILTWCPPVWTLNPCSVECEQDSWPYSMLIYSTLHVAPSCDGPFVSPHRSSATPNGSPGVTHSNTQSALYRDLILSHLASRLCSDRFRLRAGTAAFAAVPVCRVSGSASVS